MIRLFSLLIMLISFISLNAQEKFINVNGTSEVSVIADRIKFNVNIRTVAESLEQAKKENDYSLEELLKTLKEFEIIKDDIEVSPVSLGKNYEYNQRGREHKGFFAQVNINFLLKDLTKYYLLTNRLSANSGFELSSSYDISNYEAHNKSAYEKALKAAKEKAEYMAKALGLSLGNVIEIDEAGQPGPPVPLNRLSTEGDFSEQITSGKVNITRTVRVKFEIAE